MQFDRTICSTSTSTAATPPEVLATTFLRALGYGTDEEIIKLFYTIEQAEAQRRP
ncbi:MAG: hypothetical protein WDN28_11985 [Chthoniobacter sp.]